MSTTGGKLIAERCTQISAQNPTMSKMSVTKLAMEGIAAEHAHELTEWELDQAPDNKSQIKIKARCTLCGAEVYIVQILDNFIEVHDRINNIEISSHFCPESEIGRQIKEQWDNNCDYMERVMEWFGDECDKYRSEESGERVFSYYEN